MAGPISHDDVRNDVINDVRERIDECSVQAGDFVDPVGTDVYRVRYRRLTRGLRFPRLSVSGRAPLALANVIFTALFFSALVSSSRIHPAGATWLTIVAGATMVGAVAVIGLLLFVGSFTVSRATLAARHPLPVVADRSLRVAFLTTLVPDREPLAVVRATLADARALDWPAGRLDLWLLDEGTADLGTRRATRASCDELRVRRFSRRDDPRYNTAGGRFAARTKHGNVNSWLDRHGRAYDVIVAVDPDHRPLPNMLTRMLGYFRDPDVAFVVGPQEYGNFGENPIARRAQYQQHFFHGILQPAGNAAECAMHVGTNYAFRVAPLRQVGGFQDSVTEDMATGLAVHKARNPRTGGRWRSVYTPDVLAIGEGPASWTDYFTQQQRWSRGTIDTWLHQFLPGARKMSPRSFWHYTLLMSYYPATAVAWLLGALNSVLYLGFGVASIHLRQELWLVLFAWAFASQLAIFLLGRSHTVSPYEPPGSLGLTGLMMSVLCTPVYVAALIGALRGTPPRFVVTPKGRSANGDHLSTFGRHLRWAAFFAALLVVSQVRGHTNIAMRTWAVIPLIVCLTPVVLWLTGRATGAPAPAAVDDPYAGDEPTTTARPAAGQRVPAGQRVGAAGPWSTARHLVARPRGRSGIPGQRPAAEEEVA